MKQNNILLFMSLLGVLFFGYKIYTVTNEYILDLQREHEIIEEKYHIIIEELQEEIEKLQEELENEIKLNDFTRTTFYLETGYGTSKLWLENNNAGGIKCNNGWCSYDTKDDGFYALKTLMRSYVNEFGYDSQSIRYKYCGWFCPTEDLKAFDNIYERIRRI